LLLTFPAAPVFSQSITPDNPPAAKRTARGSADLTWLKTGVELTAGYRTDKLTWNIAGNRQGSGPNVLSELTWSDLKIYQLKLTNRTVIKDYLYARCYLDYGGVRSGNNRDSDYLGDNRTGEFSRSLNGVDGNDVWDVSLAVGPRISFLNASMVVCPLLGYAVSEQDLNIVDGYQAFTASPATAPQGPFSGLNSRYQTRWKGPWVGMDFLFSVPGTNAPFALVDIILTAEYHWFDYDADADWNLRAEYDHPVSFSHDAKGSGWVGGVTILLETKRHWGVNLGMNITDMTTHDGLDRTFYADGSTADTRLNEVRWRSFTVEAGISYRF
jgi:hypothetical protein